MFLLLPPYTFFILSFSVLYSTLLIFALHFIFIKVINIYYKYYEIFIVNVVINAMKILNQSIIIQVKNTY